MRNSNFQMGQRTWFIDDAGSISNTGATVGSPIPAAERRRRMGPNPLWENGDYHIRYMSTTAADAIEGECAGTSTVVYLHAGATDRVGVSPVAYTASSVDTLDTPSNQPFAITAAALTASTAVGKRIRWTNGAAVNAHAWGTLAVSGTKIRTTEFLTPVASFAVAPFAVPTTSVAAPGNTDSFVVEDLRVITRLYINLRSSPLGSSTTTRVVLDGISTTIVGALNCSVYSDGSSILTGAGEILSHTMHGCQLVSLLDNGRKVVLGGYATAGQLNLISNTTTSFGIIDHFTIQGDVHFIILGANNVGANGEGWAIGQIGMFDMTNLNNTGIYMCTVCRFRPSVPTVIYGSGNTVPPFVLHHGGMLISDAAPSTQPYASSHAASFGCGMPGNGGVIDTFTCPAYDSLTGIWTEPRLMTFASLQLSVAAGGFGNGLNHPRALIRGT